MAVILKFMMHVLVGAIVGAIFGFMAKIAGYHKIVAFYGIGLGTTISVTYLLLTMRHLENRT